MKDTEQSAVATDTSMPHTVGTVPTLAEARQIIRPYYQLTKPGIVYSNVMTAIAGYLFGGRWHIVYPVFVGLTIGTGLLIAASCVLNNYLDRTLDAKMKRTQKRPSVTGVIPLRSGMIYAAVLMTTGFMLLVMTNLLTLAIGALAVVTYVVCYGVAKRRSVHGTLVGTIPGAAALVAGYTAATAQFDQVAILLFLIMVVWQMAHFYSISIFRREDYAAAGLPVRSVSRGVRNTTRHIIGYVVLYLVLAPMLAIVSRARIVYAAVMVGVGLLWLRVAMRGLTTTEPTRWARQAFGFSLVALLLFSLALPFGVLLP